MPDSALILFAQPSEANKARRNGGGEKIHYPSYQEQIARLKPKYELLQAALEKGRLQITNNATTVDPEYTLVFETIGDPNNFYKAVNKLKKQYPNIDWILELAGDCPNTDDFYVVDDKNNRNDEKQLHTKVFCIIANQQVLTEILSLWNHYQSNSNYKFERGLTGFRNLFQTLYDVHQWGIRERLEDTNVIEYWKEDLQMTGQSVIRTQIELFFRSSVEKRAKAEQKVRDIISSIEGRVISASVIPEIEYHALLVEIPRSYIKQIINKEEVDLVLADEIMFFKEATQSIYVGSCDAEETAQITNPEEIYSEPIVALFDGIPQENHPLLQNLLSVDDPDLIGVKSPVDERIHGTSMASLILRGEKMESINSTIHKLYVRPIMQSRKDFNGRVETYVPDDFLLVDKIHECVRRLFEPTAGRVAPTVRVINLSIGIQYREFFTLISPLARLLDWLSYKYRILFIVSAGNHPEGIELGVDYKIFNTMDMTHKNELIIKYLSKNMHKLRLLSPAESMNALSIGSLFSDKNASMPVGGMTELCSNFMPAAYGSFGRGINKAIKPDILFDGGSNYVRENVNNHSIADWRQSTTKAPGIKSAYPSTERSSSAIMGYSTGTSNSAALVSNKAAECYDVLNNLFVNETGENIPYAYASVLIKAMLVHGASWGSLKGIFRDTLDLNGNQTNNEIHKYLGYGQTNIEKVKDYAKNKICLVGYGEINQDKAFEYSIPLPFDFHSRKYKRRLTVTLAYFSPIHASSQKYREKQVWFDLNDEKRVVGSRLEYDYHAVQRGTVQHEIFETDGTVVWDETDSIVIKVSCRADASENNKNNLIPYALFATFEMAPEYDIDVYQVVSSKVKVAETITTTNE